MSEIIPQSEKKSRVGWLIFILLLVFVAIPITAQTINYYQDRSSDGRPSSGVDVSTPADKKCWFENEISTMGNWPQAKSNLEQMTKKGGWTLHSVAFYSPTGLSSGTGYLFLMLSGNDLAMFQASDSHMIPVDGNAEDIFYAQTQSVQDQLLGGMLMPSLDTLTNWYDIGVEGVSICNA